MRKKIINQDVPDDPEAGDKWLNLQRLAQVEITSEDAAFPIEDALIPGSQSGWRAGQSGEQTIRLVFDKPQKIRRIYLLFRENEQSRSQEFVLRWSSDGGKTYRDIVRQQYNFNPPGEEREDYTVELSGVTALELIIIPERSGGPARASLTRLRLG
jgi:hypothetical protein